MVSWSEQPTHSTCVWFQARKCQKGLPGKAAATRDNCSTSAIMRSMTRPRYASTAMLRVCCIQVHYATSAGGLASGAFAHHLIAGHHHGDARSQYDSAGVGVDEVHRA